MFAIGESFSPELAVGAFHTQAGWISVMLVALVTIAWLEKPPWLHAGPSRTYHYPALPFLLPFVALSLSRLFTSAFTADFDFLYPARVVLVSLILIKCWPQARLGPPKVHAWLAGLGVSDVDGAGARHRLSSSYARLGRLLAAGPANRLHFAHPRGGRTGLSGIFVAPTSVAPV